MEDLPQIIHSSWHEHLMPLFEDEKMKKIKYSILPKTYFLPAPQDIFKVFSMPLKDIKVVILGQDPYPTPGHATGLAFAVTEKTPMPASLKIIQREVLNDYPDTEINSKWKTLEHWQQQGIFLLNTALTVESYKAGTHLGYWKWFIRSIVEIISEEVTPIWLLWGSQAKEYEGIARSAEVFMLNQFLIAQHPAAELYSGGKSTFKNCKHFSKVNEILESNNEQKIIW